MPGKCLGSGHTLEPGLSDRIHTQVTGVMTDIIPDSFRSCSDTIRPIRPHVLSRQWTRLKALGWTMELKYKHVCMVVNVLINIVSLKGI